MHRLFQHSLLFRPLMLPVRFRKMFLAHLLRGAAMQMVGLFVPVFLYLNAESLPLRQLVLPFNGNPMIAGLGTVCLFFLGVRFLTACIAIPSGVIIQKLGLVKSMLIGNAALVGIQLSLWQSLQTPWLVVAAIVFAAIEVMFYWTPYLTEFSAYADEKVLPKEVGFLELADRTVRAMLPMIGGLLIALIGFDGLFVTASAMILTACVLLLYSSEIHLSSRPSWTEFWQWLKHPEYRKIGIGLAGRLWDDNGLALWPIYLFLFLGTTERVGYLYTLALLASLVITYLVGSALHRIGEKRTLVFSASFLSVVWVLRSAAGQAWHFLSVDLMQRLADSVYVPTFDIFLFRFSRHQKMFEFFIYRELFISLGSILFWSSAMMLFVLGIAWKGVFVLAGLGVFASLFMTLSTMKSNEYPVR